MPIEPIVNCWVAANRLHVIDVNGTIWRFAGTRWTIVGNVMLNN